MSETAANSVTLRFLAAPTDVGHSGSVDAGTVLAESAHPVMLFEGTLPPRYYLSAADVRWDALVATQSSSICPYKGTANYWAPARGGPDIAWSYAKPLPESAAIAGLMSFYSERTDFILDGQPLARPRTPFG